MVSQNVRREGSNSAVALISHAATKQRYNTTYFYIFNMHIKRE